ncbi:hypothetical protein [Methanoregula sp.]|uniref:hypothetical protein n=1 Tax=Methanoregula sp. TaxID=2052170 RepID=UPI0035643C0C
MKPVFFFLCLLGLILVSPAMAINSTASAMSVSQYSIQAPDNYVIYQIIVDPVPMGTNQSHVLNYNGATFLLTIGSAQSYGIFNEFDIALTYPNGSLSSKHVSTTRISLGNYKTTIQPVFSQAQSLNNAYLTIDLQVGLTPVSAEFNTQPAGWLASSAIPFSSASGNLGVSTNVFCEMMTLDDFQNNVVNYNSLWGLKNLGSTVFQWTYEMVLGFISNIPVIGPLFIQLLTLLGIVLTEMSFWAVFIVTNAPAIILSLETLIIILSVVNTGKNAPLRKVLSNIYQYNVACINGFFTLIELLRGWIISLIEVITSIVQAMKLT